MSERYLVWAGAQGVDGEPVLVIICVDETSRAVLKDAQFQEEDLLPAAFAHIVCP
jgi:hypothetical protein